MKKDQSFLRSISMSYRYFRCIRSFFIFVAFSLISYASHALENNPGAVCASNSSQGSFTSADYTNLVSALNTNNYVSIAGNASGSIPLQVKIDTIESSTSTVRSNFGITDNAGTRAINIRRTFPTINDFTDIRLDFRSSITEQPIFLTNVALSAFDIDYANGNGNTFDDYVQITGITEAGNTIEANFQPIAGSNINYFQGLYTTSTFNCPAKNFGTACQGSVQFSQPVASINIRYTNTGRLRTTTNQEIDFRVDNYCYVPQYFFSGIVFNDAGGITDAEADATNDNLTTGVYANRPNYFNGIFNAPQESGISGSTVKLTNCNNTAVNYGSQTVTSAGAGIGRYQISVPISAFGGNTSNLCLLEERSNTLYPVRTTTDRRPISFTSTTYNYPNNNFGRVIAANVGLVLTKAQYLNNCPATLNYASINSTSSPATGFSTAPISNIEPGRCIAYKITATNRANVNINSIIVRDTLQRQGVGGALVTSVLANPALSTDYAASSPAVGQNGTLVTTPLTLNPRTKRDFYFNTKYGSTQ